ncbi:MAG: Crp/Fnr family transcriptional regulator [Proteobacteria bacterium]|nr:MAG: Crp/Fnr family transcriptional regulator [Pseudomonadota bacterium]
MEFFNTIAGLAPGESRELQLFIETHPDYFAPLLLSRNETLVAQGETCRYLCLIQKGILQHSIILDGNEKTTYIGLKNSITTSLASFLNQMPSRKSIKAISDCELLVIDREKFRELLSSNATFRTLYYDLIERQICLIDDYRIDLLTLSPEERYAKLLRTEPDLLHEVPLHYLASLLGISGRHMSRIRKSILR